MGWSGAAGAVARAAEAPGMARSIAQGAAGAGAVLGAGAALGEVTGGKLPDLRPGSLFEFTFTSVGERSNTPEARAIRERYGLDRGTPQQQAEATRRLWLDALNREREWEGSAIAVKHPDWTDEQVRREWVRYWLGEAAARDLDRALGEQTRRNP